MKELGAKNADELHIEVTLQTILDPCNVCQGQMQRFQQLYNTKIKVYSSGAKKGEKFKELYPKFNVKNPKKK
jgi:cytidine deaminase